MMAMLTKALVACFLQLFLLATAFFVAFATKDTKDPIVMLLALGALILIMVAGRRESRRIEEIREELSKEDDR
jgi:predicted permease